MFFLIDTSKGKRHHNMLVTYAVIDDSPGLLKIAGLLCAGAFQKAVIANISVPGKISVFLMPFNTERNNALVEIVFLLKLSSNHAADPT